MLTRVGSAEDAATTSLPICEASFPAPFVSGLEFNAPARGPWNIVHTGMLIPESHQVFVCAEGCLRGVVLTAAEMNAMDRMSWVSVCENDMFNGQMEQNVIEGVSDIIFGLDTRPRAVLLFISCIHLFAGVDFKMMIDELSSRFPDIGFIDCYMHPTMRKSGLNPDQTMRKQLYALLKPCDLDKGWINIIGNDRPTDTSSELYSILEGAGFGIRDITRCTTFDEYLQMAASAYDITYLPATEAAGDELERRLGHTHIHLPLSYSYGEIAENYAELTEALGIPMPELSGAARAAEESLEIAFSVIGETPIEIDYTSTSRPLGLSRMLIEHGFTVTKVYADELIDEEREDFDWLRNNEPDLVISATVHAAMRFAAHPAPEKKTLAIGQKAAYFSGSRNFVNIVAGGGMYGYDGIRRLADLLVDAFQNEKDTKTVISRKGLGCESCL